MNAVGPVSRDDLRHELTAATLNLKQITDDGRLSLEAIFVFTKLCLSDNFSVFQDDALHPIGHAMGV